MLRVLLSIVAVAAAVACGREASLADRLACAPVEGVDLLLAQPESDHIVVDSLSDPDAARQASQAIACVAAARGESVAVGARAEAAAQIAGPLARRGGAVDGFHLTEAETPAGLERRAAYERDRIAGEARNSAFAADIDAHGDSADRVILVVDSPDGARAPVGLSGHTWRPLGARLPEGRVVSLRAETTSRPGIRIVLMPFEDLPERGAALRYDGVIQVGPSAQQSARVSSAEAPAR